METLRKWKNGANRNKLMIALALFILLMIPMQIVYQHLQATCDVKLMDFLIGYDADTVYYILDTISANGRSEYLFLIALDLCYGLVYAAVFFLSISLLLKKCGASAKWDILLLLPLLAMLFDYLENICTTIHIFTFPTVNSIITGMECTGTCLKYLFLLDCLIVIVILAILTAWKKRK